MTDAFQHEAAYRGREAIERLGRLSVTVCGAGALGSLLADNLVRQGVRQLAVIDDDRVEEHNVGTQLYGRADVGGLKVELLRAHLFRAAGVEATAHAKRLDERTARKLLRGAELVVDAFDNSASRRIVAEHCIEQGVACLHLGMNADYGEVRWNEVYRVPADAPAPDVCDVPLARNLILLVVAAGTESVLRWALAGRRESYTVTLKDLQIRLEPTS
jgi:molybdopterin/thiamine biosynthesis adenylyltransferase